MGLAGFCFFVDFRHDAELGNLVVLGSKVSLEVLSICIREVLVVRGNQRADAVVCLETQGVVFCCGEMSIARSV